MGDLIPHRSKQASIPFSLKPNPSVDLAEPVIYSFKRGDTYDKKNGAGLTGSYQNKRILGIYPDSYERAIQEDISMKHLYPMAEYGVADGKDITFDTILQHIPAITIREYIPDTRLDSVLNFFTKFYSIITGLFEKSKDEKKDELGNKLRFTKEDTKKLFAAIGKLAEWAFEYITGTGDLGTNPLWDNVDKTDGEEIGNANGLGAKNDQLKSAIFSFPFTLYYCFLSSITTNIYEFPAVTSDGRLYSSTGHEGWNTGANEFSVTGLLSKIPGVGTLLKNTLNNISINFMPWWDATSGHKTAEPDITIKFHLFNDNIVKAVTNFICVNTLIANNKWYQYNLFLHSSSLYEIKLDGYNRLFACTCNAVVRSVGNLRSPPRDFGTLIRANCKGLVDDETSFTNALLLNKLVKIPDVYEVELTFKSILPANFNNFMYQYSSALIDTVTPRKEELVSMSLQAAYSQFGEEAAAKFKDYYGGASGGSDAGGEDSGGGSKPATEGIN